MMLFGKKAQEFGTRFIFFFEIRKISDLALRRKKLRRKVLSTLLHRPSLR